jgi:hypothetical protein
MSRFAATTGASPSPRVGRMSRRATGGHRRMIVAVASAAEQNSAYRLTRRYSRFAAVATCRYSSSGRNTPSARHELHTGRAVSRSPRGIDTWRMG